MEIKAIFIIIHLIGVALGAGGAYMSDLMFIYSIRDRKISKTEINFMELGSKLVWFGLFVLFASGLAMFSLNAVAYMASSKFQIKMFIVLVLVLNGLVFKFVHMPKIKRHSGHHYPSSDEFRRGATWLLLSGTISIMSWTSSIVLGSMRSIDFTFFQGVVIYFFLILISFVAAIALKNRIFFTEKSKK